MNHGTHGSDETLADVLAEMRGIRVREFQDFADRIEAAHKREVDEQNSVIQAQRSAFDAEQDRQRRVVPGNAAAMREVLDEIRVAAMSDYEWDADQLIETCNAAISAPPRNCDVGTTEEQRARFDKFCRSNSWDEIDGAHCMSSCPLYHGDYSRCEELEWAQMPYEVEEGGNNNVV